MKQLIIGLSGASGVIYGIRLLEVLKQLKVVSHLVMTKWAEKIIELETDFKANDVKALASHAYDIDDLAAPICSGSFKTDGMVVIPCSMKTLSYIAQGHSHNALLRATDVTLKERRKLVLVVRETPLSTIHLRNMLEATDAGALILPAMPAFYHMPKTIDDLVNHIVGKVLDVFDITHTLYRRWGEGITTRDK